MGGASPVREGCRWIQRQKAAGGWCWPAAARGGSYQVGVWRALDELGWTAGAVTGTSVGCLNGAMYVLGQYETARDMWLTIRSEDVMELPDPAAGPRALGEAVRQIVAEGGLDISPLEGIVARVLDEDALRASPIKFGLVTVEKRGLRPHELTLDEIPRGQLADYLLASAAFYPAMPARSIDGVEYLDGGYSNNMPTGLAARLGAEELVCVDLEGLGFTKPNRTGLPTTTIRSHWELGEILKFDPAVARRNIELGYYDTLRAFGRLRGDAYPVALPGSTEAAAEFRARFDPPAGGGQSPLARGPSAGGAGACPGGLEGRTPGPRWKPRPRPPGWTRPGCIRSRSWKMPSSPPATRSAWPALTLCLSKMRKTPAAPRWPPGPRCCRICSCRPLSAGR